MTRRGPFEWPIRAFMVELTLSCLVLLVAICVLAGQIAQLEDRIDQGQQQAEQQARTIDLLQCNLIAVNHEVYPQLPRITAAPSSDVSDPCDAWQGQP